MFKRYIIIIMLVMSSCSNDIANKNKTSLNLENELEIYNNNKLLENAKIAFAEYDYIKSSSLYEKLLKKESNNIDYLFYLAESLRLSNKNIEALKIYDKILKLDEDFIPALEGKAFSYLYLNKFGEAEKLLNKVLDIDAASWKTVNALGIINSLTNRYEYANEYYDLAKELSKGNPSILNNLGLSIGLGFDSQKGIEYLNEALSYDVENPKILKQINNNLALLHGISGDFDKAKEILLNNKFSQAAIYNNLGFYAKLAKDNELAKSYLSKALSSSPTYYEKAWNNLKSIQ